MRYMHWTVCETWALTLINTWLWNNMSSQNVGLPMHNCITSEKWEYILITRVQRNWYMLWSTAILITVMLSWSAYPNTLYWIANCKLFKTPQPECCVESASMTKSLQHWSHFTGSQWNFALNTTLCLLTFNSLHDHGPEFISEMLIPRIIHLVVNSCRRKPIHWCILRNHVHDVCVTHGTSAQELHSWFAISPTVSEEQHEWA